MRDLLKFITCGSVDDGKSTLIGHLLYDSKLIYADQASALELESKVGSRGGAIDYSLLLDGLAADREQGITIDVAYRYFTTDNRSFICADTPGHEEYTRNMAVGASFADLAVILVDASQGVLVQTRRHARICALVGIRSFVFAVNKMDLVGYDPAVFAAIQADIEALAAELGLPHVQLIPVSATEGDNITAPSPHTPWYDGLPLLPYLETVDADTGSRGTGFYMPVQRVSRPDHTFRGFQGQVEADRVAVGDAVRVLPSGQRAHVRSLLVAGAPADEACFGQPVTIQLDREVDVSRGCVIERDAGLKVAAAVTATILWMDDVPLAPGCDYFVKLGTREIPGLLTQIHYAVDVNTGAHLPCQTLEKNGIAVVQLAFTEPIVVDAFKNHRTMGELILIDRVSHATAAAGVVERVDDAGADGSRRAPHLVAKGQPGIVAELPVGTGAGYFTVDQVRAVGRVLRERGVDAYVYVPEADDPQPAVLTHLAAAGVTVLVACGATAEQAEQARPAAPRQAVFRFDAGADPVSLAASIVSLAAPAADDAL